MALYSPWHDGGISNDNGRWYYFGKNRRPVDWLIEGYKRNGDLGENFEKKMHLVKIEIALSLLIYYGDAGHSFAKDITIKNLTDDISFFKQNI